MTTNPQALEDIREITELIKSTVPVERIYLFGSYAYGEPHPDSDYDFFVVLPDDSVRPLEAMRTIRRNFSRLKRRKPIDLLADKQSSFDHRRQLNTLEKIIDRDGVRVYG